LERKTRNKANKFRGPIPNIIAVVLYSRGEWMVAQLKLIGGYS
jgi:hypothetical protein